MNKLKQLSYGDMIPKGIVIHNTGNNLSARENYDLMMNTDFNISVHYFVDEKEVISALPINKTAFHTGKGLDKGNMQTIAIEICRSTCDEKTYLKAQKRAITLIKSLLKKLKLQSNRVYCHNQFDRQAYCPHRILDMYGSFIEFKRKELDT